ncbi:MAG: heavy-metal-associated domain-containing protein [Deltaproteobacteria bacterium]|nr:heavy-metal-associated domain-containing protein [Deltaproteobacteria bacterium]
MIRNRSAVLIMGAILSSQAAFPKTINVSVNGMVCAFCVQGITKRFRKEAAIKDVHVDLDKKIVSLKINDGKDISDEVIKKDIIDSGFNIVEIKREPL